VPSSQPEHPNAALVRSLFAAFRAADLEAIHEAIPEDAVWHFPGRLGRIAGNHRGRTQILEFLGRVVELTSGTFSLDLIDVVANDHWAVALFTGHGTREGRTLDNPTCLRIRIRDGRMVEVHEFVWDLYDVDAFWA